MRDSHQKNGHPQRLPAGRCATRSRTVNRRYKLRRRAPGRGGNRRREAGTTMNAAGVRNADLWLRVRTGYVDARVGGPTRLPNASFGGDGRGG
jgi:hypothetical protein